jgi:hypothetical protein
VRKRQASDATDSQSIGPEVDRLPLDKPSLLHLKDKNADDSGNDEHNQSDQATTKGLGRASKVVPGSG